MWEMFAPMILPAIGGLLGGIFGGDEGPQSQESMQKTLPPWLEEYWQSLMANTSGLTSQPYPSYSGPRVADLSEPQLAGIDLAYQRATQGAPDLNAARGMTMDFTGGNYLANPYLNNNYTAKVIADNADQMSRSFAQGTAAQNDAAFNRQGAYGGSAWSNKQTADAEALARSIGAMGNQYNLANATLGAGDYRQGTGQMLDAGRLAGQLSQDDWTAADMLAKAGGTLQNQNQKLLDTAYNEFWQQQMWPFQMAQFQQGMLSPASGMYGGTNSTMTGPGGSPWANALGGAGIGAAINKSAPELGKGIWDWLSKQFGGGSGGGGLNWSSGGLGDLGGFDNFYLD
jgi:hypothetical protein